MVACDTLVCIPSFAIMMFQRGIAVGLASEAPLRHAANAEAAHGEEASAQGAVGGREMITHRRDIDRVQRESAKDEAGNLEHRKFDFTVEAAVGGVAPNGAGSKGGGPEETFRVDGCAVRQAVVRRIIG